MSVKTTVTLTRKQAINHIIEKRIELLKRKLENEINLLSNDVLENLLDKVYYDSKFENYSVIDDGSDENETNN